MNTHTHTHRLSCSQASAANEAPSFRSLLRLLRSLCESISLFPFCSCLQDAPDTLRVPHAKSIIPGEVHCILKVMMRRRVYETITSSSLVAFCMLAPRSACVLGRTALLDEALIQLSSCLSLFFIFCARKRNRRLQV